MIYNIFVYKMTELKDKVCSIVQLFQQADNRFLIVKCLHIIKMVYEIQWWQKIS